MVSVKTWAIFDVKPYYLAGLELALRHSRVGDSVRVKCAARFAWGYSGLKEKGVAIIPPNADVEFDFKVLSHSLIPPPSAQRDEPEDQNMDDVTDTDMWLDVNLRKVWYSSCIIFQLALHVSFSVCLCRRAVIAGTGTVTSFAPAGATLRLPRPLRR